MNSKATSSEGAETVRDVALPRPDDGLAQREHDNVLERAVELGRLRRTFLLQACSIFKPLTWTHSGRAPEAFVAGLFIGTIMLPVLSLADSSAAAALAAGFVLLLIIVRAIVGEIFFRSERLLEVDDLREIRYLQKRADALLERVESIKLEVGDAHSRSTLSGEELEADNEVDNR